jgi:geranylgeranyl reductase family protein
MDVVIVGAGPAGASAARVAAAAGLSTLVIDRKQFAGEPIQCAEWVPRSLLSHVTQHAGCLQRTDNLVTEAPGGMHSVMPMPGAMVDRARFDSVLCANARAQGAKFHWHIRLRAVDPVLRQITVIRNRREMQIRFRRLIAADGPRSRVAQLLGMPVMPMIQSRQYRVAVGSPLQDIHTWLSPEYPGGYAWLFPRGKHANLGIAMGACTRAGSSSGRYESVERSLQKNLDALHLRLVGSGQVDSEVLSMTGGAIPVGGLRKQLVAGPVLFAGDAAGCVDPITGAGIANAVYSGEMAGSACVDGLLHRNRNALSAYDEELRELLAGSQRHALERRRWLESSAEPDLRYAWIGFSAYHEALPLEKTR